MEDMNRTSLDQAEEAITNNADADANKQEINADTVCSDGINGDGNNSTAQYDAQSPDDDDFASPVHQDQDQINYRMGMRNISAKHGNIKKKKSLKREIIGWVVTIVAAVLVALLVRSFVFIMVQVDGSSMLDTLHNENRLFVWRAGYLFDDPRRGDVVICHYPDNEGNYDENVNYVKRVIGLPGDTVSIEAGDVYINGQKLDEPYVSLNRKSVKEYRDPVTLGEDEYFVMGDNRNNSRDSRYVGAIKRDQIVGKAIWKLYPFDQIGSVE